MDPEEDPVAEYKQRWYREKLGIDANDEEKIQELCKDYLRGTSITCLKGSLFE